jgi:hypothetical protein
MKMKTKQVDQVEGDGLSGLQLSFKYLPSGGIWPHIYLYILLYPLRTLVLLVDWCYELNGSACMNVFVRLNAFSYLCFLAKCPLWLAAVYILAMLGYVKLFLPPCLLMDSRPNSKAWNVLCWNIRGINAEGKWTSLRNKIMESNYDIVTIQETKRAFFDISYIRKFCPNSFDSFCFLPSLGASG